MKTFRIGGIHPSPDKLTADSPTRIFDEGSEYRIMLTQSIGAPSKCIVKVNDHVDAGQKIADAGGFVGAPVHSPVSGIVKKIEPTRDMQGFWRDSVVIIADEDSPNAEVSPRSQFEIDSLTASEIIDEIGENGIVGLGGATFPTRVKLSVPAGKKVEVVILNGAECEPMLTCDDRLMREHPEEILKGALLLMRAVGVERCIVGIEENKPQAIAAMTTAANSQLFPGISVVTLKKKYPQGGEKQLIEAVIGKRVPLGGLPIDAGAIVDNVATAYSVWDAIANRRPLTERIVTVTGDSLSNPGNYLVKIGTPIEKLIEAAGGLPAGECKVIAGGPMMGRAISQLSSPTTKGLSGIVVITGVQQYRKPSKMCIRCSACVDHCPMGLEPYLLMLQGENNLWEEMGAHQVSACIECGCCSYVCPSSRPILDYIKLGKAQLRKIQSRK